MEIVKINEQNLITGFSKYGYKISGFYTKEENNSGGNLHLNVDVFETETEIIGNIQYNKPIKGKVHVSCISSEEMRQTVMQISDEIINFLLERIKE